MSQPSDDDHVEVVPSSPVLRKRKQDALIVAVPDKRSRRVTVTLPATAAKGCNEVNQLVFACADHLLVDNRVPVDEHGGSVFINEVYALMEVERRTLCKVYQANGRRKQKNTWLVACNLECIEDDVAKMAAVQRARQAHYPNMDAMAEACSEVLQAHAREQIRGSEHFLVCTHGGPNVSINIYLIEMHLARQALAQTYAILSREGQPMPYGMVQMIGGLAARLAYGSRKLTRAEADHIALLSFFERCCSLQQIYDRAARLHLFRTEDGRQLARYFDEATYRKEMQLAAAESSCDGAESSSAERNNRMSMRERISLKEYLEDDRQHRRTADYAFADRLLTAGAEPRLARRMLDTLAAAWQVFGKVAQHAPDASFCQDDYFLLLQLMRAHNEIAVRGTTNVDETREFGDAVAAVSRVRRQLHRHTEVTNARWREMARSALGTAERSAIGEHCEALHRTVDVGTLLTLAQQSGSTNLRKFTATPVPCRQVELKAALAFVDANALVGDRFALLRMFGDTPHHFTALRLPLNTQRKFVGTFQNTNGRQYHGDGMQPRDYFAANNVTPMAVLTSMLTFAPGARDGVDYLICYTPFSFLKTSDTQEEDAVAPVRGRGRPRKSESAGRVSVPIGEPAVYVVLRHALLATLLANTAPLTVLQRCGARPDIGRHLPMCSAALARTLATACDESLLCTALNSTLALCGIQWFEWRAGTAKAARLAQRTARVLVGVAEMFASEYMRRKRTDVLDARFAIDMVLVPMLLRRRAIEGAADSAELIGRSRSRGRRSMHCGHQRSVLDALGVLCHGGSMPLLCGREEYEFLESTVYNKRTGHLAHERMAANFHVCNELQKARNADPDTWQKSPSWRRQLEDYNKARRTLSADECVPEKLLERGATLVFVDKPVQAAYTKLLCPCGGVIGAECAHMTVRILGEEFDLYMCCLCAAEFVPKLDRGAQRSHRICAGYCTTCRQRVPYRRRDADELALPEHVQITHPPCDIEVEEGDNPYEVYESAARELVAPVEIGEHILQRAFEQPEELSPLLNVLESLAFRVRQWRTAPMQPQSYVSQVDGWRIERAIESFVDYAELRISRMETLPALDIRVFPSAAVLGIFDDWYATCSARFPCFLSEFLGNTRAALAQQHAGVSRKPERYDALALLLSCLEGLSFMRVETALNLLDNEYSANLSATRRLANAMALHVFLFPVPINTDLRAYESGFDEHAVARHFPLVRSALAESSALGGNGFRSLASEWRRDQASLIEEMFSSDKEPRPLTGALALLPELWLINWYGPHSGAEE